MLPWPACYPRPVWLALVTLSVDDVTTAGAPAAAQSLEDWLQRDTMTGDWGALGTRLQYEGLILRAHYLSETTGKPTGGLRQGRRYAQQIDSAPTSISASLSVMREGRST